MKLFYDYDIKYPDLIISILEYFWLEGDFNKKTVIGFCANNKYNNAGKGLSPQIILKICDILMDNNILSLIVEEGHWVAILVIHSFGEILKRNGKPLNGNTITYVHL